MMRLLRMALVFGALGLTLPANAAAALLADAAEEADCPRARTVLKAGADTNAVQKDGATALHWAAYHGDAGTVKLLLAAGANVKAENRYGFAPLSLACENGAEDLVRMLLAAGADPNTAL